MLHAMVPVCVLAATVLLVLITTVDRSSPEHRALAWADLTLGSLLVVEWLARFMPNVSLRFDHDDRLRALAPLMSWLIVDGIASLAHVTTAALAVAGIGHTGQIGDPKLAIDILSCLRTLRLVTMVRNTSTAELVIEVLWKSSQALKGPLYFLAASTVFFGVAVSRKAALGPCPLPSPIFSHTTAQNQVFYAELLTAPISETSVDSGFDTLGNAIWFGIVTFSTVGYGDYTPRTLLGKAVSVLGIASGMLWCAMPIAIVGSTFQAEWGRRNLHIFAEALQTELLEHGMMTHDLYKKFLLIDTDQDGELDEQEFAEYIMSHARLNWLSSSQVRGIFELLDPNNSGRVSYSELVRAVFPVNDSQFHASAEEFVLNPDGTRFTVDACPDEGAQQQEEEPVALPASYAERPHGDLDVQVQALGVQLGKLQQEMQQEVGALKAGQERMLARLERVLAAVDKLQAAQGGGGQVAG